MPGPWKAWKTKSGFPTLSTAPRDDDNEFTFLQPNPGKGSRPLLGLLILLRRSPSGRAETQFHAHLSIGKCCWVRDLKLRYLRSCGNSRNLSVPGTQASTLRVLYQGRPSGVPDGSLTEWASALEFAAKASNRQGAAAKADWLPTRLFGTAEAALIRGLQRGHPYVAHRVFTEPVAPGPRFVEQAWGARPSHPG